MSASATVERVWAHISAERLLQATYRFVDTPSPTGSEAGFARVYADHLRDVGLEVELDEEFPDSPSVVARLRGRRSRPVLQFDGHTDAIPTPHTAPSLDLAAGIVRGRGAADMKGGLAAIAEALRAIRAAGVELDGSALVTAHGLHEAPLGDQRTLRSLILKGVIGDRHHALHARLGGEPGRVGAGAGREPERRLPRRSGGGGGHGAPGAARGTAVHGLVGG
jgi:Peptidase family M20/M25/M40